MIPEERITVLQKLAAEFFLTDEEREAVGWAVAMLHKDPQEAPDESTARYIQELERQNLKLQKELEDCQNG